MKTRRRRSELEIILKSGKYGEKIMLIDDEDYEKIKDRTVVLNHDKSTGNFYARLNVYCAIEKKMKTALKVHRVLLDAKQGEIVDHINHNTLDNRKCNLRICTNSENQRNTRSRRNSTSKYKGVQYRKDSKKWRARITCTEKGYRDFNIGTFCSEIEAAKAYNKKARELFGEFAFLNKV